MENATNLNDVDFAAIEKRARALRAQAVKDGFQSFKNALASIQFSFRSKRTHA